MEVQLRPITDLEEALTHAACLDRWAAEAMAEYRDDELPPDVARRFLERHFERPETLLLIAEEDGQNRGVCLVGPFEDPLTAEVVPFVAILYVDPELRHRGLARALVAEVRRLLAARGLRRLAARAAHNDDALISMGERWGFLRQWELMLHE